MTGTFAGLTPVAGVDGRRLPALGEGGDASGPMTRRLRQLYFEVRAEEARDRESAR